MDQDNRSPALEPYRPTTGNELRHLDDYLHSALRDVKLPSQHLLRPRLALDDDAPLVRRCASNILPTREQAASSAVRIVLMLTVMVMLTFALARSPPYDPPPGVSGCYAQCALIDHDKQDISAIPFLLLFLLLDAWWGEHSSEVAPAHRFTFFATM